MLDWTPVVLRKPGDKKAPNRTELSKQYVSQIPSSSYASVYLLCFRILLKNLAYRSAVPIPSLYFSYVFAEHKVQSTMTLKRNSMPVVTKLLLPSLMLPRLMLKTRHSQWPL